MTSSYTDPLQRALDDADRRDFDAYKRWLRHLERQSDHGEDVAERAGDEFLRSDPGYPLGVGFPLGGLLREDGESHRDAWMRVIRTDPCSFCGRPGGTVDHIEPTAGGGKNVWVNYTGACASCNSSKGDTPMLLFMRGRVPERNRDFFKTKHPSPNKATRKRLRRSALLRGT